MQGGDASNNSVKISPVKIDPLYRLGDRAEFDAYDFAKYYMYDSGNIKKLLGRIANQMLDKELST